MYRYLKRLYWWPGMKKDIVEFVAKCQNCQHVKYEHQRPAVLLQGMPIPKLNWERIVMDFMVGLPDTLGKLDSIWVVVDRLTKSAHFIPVSVDYNAQQLAKIYVKEIVRLHGVPLSIISDREKDKDEPIAILDRNVRKLRNKDIKSVKVQWKHLPVKEATWETEKDMRDKYPQLFDDSEFLSHANHRSRVNSTGVEPRWRDGARCCGTVAT
ncbi:hypothetical protein MTR67_047939 [Solanum verrucosum]|uniref:Uncharacterized protein n=1 Tax=Solanum verrucosum TaxID=315347 RepID=A0AAF0UZY1_SOLVR|nr:hypothetical protein MTR67_047939 [Solanum verrucosum]